jgi:hypothetical protein
MQEMQSPRSTLRRNPKSAKNPDGKLAAPAINVRVEANAPAWLKVNPNEEMIKGRITAITPLKRCSVIWAAELAASRPQTVNGELNALALSIFDIVSSASASSHDSDTVATSTMRANCLLSG